jgi:hypothetical protein
MKARIDPLAYAVLLPTLYAAHTVADHVVQTDHQAANKASSWRAMAGHVGGYQVTQALAVGGVLAATGLRHPGFGVLAGMAFSAATHAFLDRRWPVVRLLELTASPNFARAVIPGQEALVAPASVRHVYGPGGAREVGRKPTHAAVRAQPLPIHGPYLADQALHIGCLAAAAAIMAWGAKR